MVVWFPFPENSRHRPGRQEQRGWEEQREQQIRAHVARVSAIVHLCSVHMSMISDAVFRGATQYREVNASEGDPCAASLTALG